MDTLRDRVVRATFIVSNKPVTKQRQQSKKKIKITTDSSAYQLSIKNLINSYLHQAHQKQTTVVPEN